MPNQHAVDKAQQAAREAKKARIELAAVGGAINVTNGRSGLGLEHLAKSVELLAEAVAALGGDSV